MRESLRMSPSKADRERRRMDEDLKEERRGPPSRQASQYDEQDHNGYSAPGPERSHYSQNEHIHELPDGQRAVVTEDIDMTGGGYEKSQAMRDVDCEDCKQTPDPRKTYKSKEVPGSREIGNGNGDSRPKSGYGSDSHGYKNDDRKSASSTHGQYRDRSPEKRDSRQLQSGHGKAKPPPPARRQSHQDSKISDYQDPRGPAKEKQDSGYSILGYKIGGSTSSSQNDSMATRIRQLEATLRERDGRVTALSTENANLATSFQIQEKDMRAGAAARSRLENEVMDLTSQVRVVQELMLKKAPKTSGGLADEDKTIRHNFKKLQTDIRDWGRQWANNDIGTIQNWQDPERSQILRCFAQVLRIDDDKLPEGLVSNQSIASKSPAICLSALVYNEICISILEKPFRPLEACTSDAPAPETRLLPKGDITLESIYRELTHFDEKKAQAWRCQTLEILDPSLGESGAIAKARAMSAKRRLRISQELSAEFLLRSPAAALFRSLKAPEEKVRADELQAIFQQAIEMSARLWKQPTILKCKRFQDLTDEPFTGDSEFMDAHPLHQLGFGDEDEDETRLDHHRIMMVVSPAILGLGDSDGENYARHRVWAKAVVWLED